MCKSPKYLFYTLGAVAHLIELLSLPKSLWVFHFDGWVDA